MLSEFVKVGLVKCSRTTVELCGVDAVIAEGGPREMFKAALRASQRAGDLNTLQELVANQDEAERILAGVCGLM